MTPASNQRKQNKKEKKKAHGKEEKPELNTENAADVLPQWML